MSFTILLSMVYRVNPITIGVIGLFYIIINWGCKMDYFVIIVSVLLFFVGICYKDALMIVGAIGLFYAGVNGVCDGK